ncbi:hypothetical protein HID58_041646, partial [Brassica napus]
RDERLQGKKTETGLSSSPFSPSTCLYSSSLCSSGICTPPENAPLSSAAESETNTRLILNLLSCLPLSLYLYVGLVLPLQRTDEIHIPNPSWMQSPSYEEAWKEPHIWFRPNKLCAKRHKMLEDMEKDFEGGQEADKFDGGGGSKAVDH